MTRDVMGLADQTHVDGPVISPPLSESAHLLEALEQRALPFVRIAPKEIRNGSPYVDIDDARIDDAGAATGPLSSNITSPTMPDMDGARRRASFFAPVNESAPLLRKQ